MQNIYLTPGPTEVHPVVKAAFIEAIETGIGAISHRSKQYEVIQAFTEEQLRTLLAVPEDSQIFFLSSGTEAWERIIQNGVVETSLHLVNGSFSKRFFETAHELGKKPLEIKKPIGKGFDLTDLPEKINAELLCVTQNETSSGVCLPNEFIGKLASKFPETLLAVDAVSCAPYIATDLSGVDYYFFSVQKFFCMPAGLGVLIVSDRALKKASDVKNKGLSIGAHHSFPSLVSFAKKNQTPSTPNVLGIYALGKVAEHFNQLGIEKLRSETLNKATLLYSSLAQSTACKAFVAEERWRSKTVITVDAGTLASKISQELAAQGLIVGSGYGELKDSQFRVANFSAHTQDAFERLCSALAKY